MAGLLSEKLAPYPVNVQVSFEFKNRKAMPVLSGIVVASEHEALILEVCEIGVSYYNSLTPIRVFVG